MIENDDLLTASSEKGNYVRQRMNQWVDQYDYVGDVRGIGLSIELILLKTNSQKKELLKKH